MSVFNPKNEVVNGLTVRSGSVNKPFTLKITPLVDVQTFEFNGKTHHKFKLSGIEMRFHETLDDKSTLSKENADKSDFIVLSVYGFKVLANNLKSLSKQDARAFIRDFSQLNGVEKEKMRISLGKIANGRNVPIQNRNSVRLELAKFTSNRPESGGAFLSVSIVHAAQNGNTGYQFIPRETQHIEGKRFGHNLFDTVDVVHRYIKNIESDHKLLYKAYEDSMGEIEKDPILNDVSKVEPVFIYNSSQSGGGGFNKQPAQTHSGSKPPFEQNGDDNIPY